MTDYAYDEMRELLPDFLNGKLDAEARAMVAAHVARCAGCADELALLGRARALMHRAPAVDVGRIVAALPRPGVATTPRELVLVSADAPAAGRAIARRARWGVGRRPLAIAASLLLAAGVTGLGVWQFVNDGGRPSATLTAVAPTGDAGVRATDAASGETTVGAPSAAPVATAADAGGVAPSALLAVNLASMSDAEMEGLLAELNALDALPALEPRAVTMVPGAPDGGGGEL